MNIDEIRQAKADLEDKIAALLDKFVEESGMNIAELSMDKRMVELRGQNMFIDTGYIATIKVEL